VRKIQRLAAIGAMTVLTMALGACGDSDEPDSAPAGEPAATTAETTESAPSPTDTAAPPAEGVTQISDITGPGCDRLPNEGEGSAQDMADAPAATAVSANPQLSTLEATIKSAHLVDTLNSAETLTVFAPVNSAFDALPPGAFQELTTDPDAGQPNSRLAQVLTTHVLSTRHDAQSLQQASTVPSLQGTQLTIGGTAPDALTVSSGEVIANVICANIPTVNATVFLIDRVLTPTAS
jgi:uncharacterized surface protein with fasciclin (FAS1) repeats